jgi:hypothetical protein
MSRLDLGPRDDNERLESSRIQPDVQSRDHAEFDELDVYLRRLDVEALAAVAVRFDLETVLQKVRLTAESDPSSACPVAHTDES